MKTLFVTGGAGFIGSALIRHLISHTDYRLVNIDKLTYAGNLASLESVCHHARYHFEQVDITASGQMSALFHKYQPDGVLHLAAESHVDRSIDGANDFIHTNIVGTFSLLENCREYYDQLAPDKQATFRFLHVSTDEVFGDLSSFAPAFTEQTPYAPSSPYSASKASSDHLVRAWYRTYGLPVLLTNCSNNYGGFHFPEKLIPLMILNGLNAKPLPIYGNGMQIRDWLFVDDHARALQCVFERGKVGESYNIGGDNQLTNLHVVQAVCDQLNFAKKQGKLTAFPATEQVVDFHSLITFVPDRPGHDQRYAMDTRKIKQELGWQPQETFASGIRKTVDWYLQNSAWWQPILAHRYAGERLGVLK